MILSVPPPPSSSRLSLLALDDLVLDKILSLLSDNDLRAFHQVSRAAKILLEMRPLEDKRRKACVQKIRENKENEINNNNNKGKRNSASALPPAINDKGEKKESEVKRMKECKDVSIIPSLRAVENLIMELEAKEGTDRKEEDSFCIASPLNCSICSVCFTGEHPGTPCRIIDSESFSEESSDPDVSASVPNSNKLKSSGTSQEKRTRVTKAKASLKKSLRRIARL